MICPTPQGHAKPGRRQVIGIRPLHRILGTIVLLFTLYFGITGLMIQAVDLHAILSHAAATDPEMLAIRESLNGSGNYEVIAAADYASPALPRGYDFRAAQAEVLQAVRHSAGTAASLEYLELRMVDGKPIGIAKTANGMLWVDPATGSIRPNPAPYPRGPQAPSIHKSIKQWHRFSAMGDGMSWLNALIGICLFVTIVTGLVLYFQLLRTRRRAGLNAIFWSTGGWWRSLHRWISIVAAAFLLVVSISGTLLSIDGFALGIYQFRHKNEGRYSRFPPGMVADYSSPLQDAKLPAMLGTTLNSFQALPDATPIKVLRLRYFSGMPQGVIVAGGDHVDDARQLVFNAETGKRVSMTEPGYPKVAFPFGWEEHELMKQVHRGDLFGVPGRLMDVFAGLSLVFVSISGLTMYVDLLRKRQRGGRRQLFWT